jgi:hypothetical protein
MAQFAGLAGAPYEQASPNERENAHATCSHNGDPEAGGGSITSHLNRQNMVDHVRVCQSRKQYGKTAGESQNSHRTSLHDRASVDRSCSRYVANGEVNSSLWQPDL